MLQFFPHELVFTDSPIELLGITSIFALVGTLWTKFNCHEHGCLRLSWHHDKDGHPVCKVHHPDHPALGWFRQDKTHPRHRKAKKLAENQESDPQTS